jgi:ferritin-like metal-binding protein YciE
MQTGHELFVHGLSDMMDGERQLVDVLQENADDSSREDLKKAFEQHRKQTEGQIERLEQCFELLGEQAEDTECHGIRGLAEEKRAFTKEDPSEDLIDVFNVGAGVKAESYEICAYQELIELARQMKHNKVAKLLGQNLKEEQATLKKMEGFRKKVKPNEMMTEEEEQRGEDRGSQRRSVRSTRSSRSRRAA